MDESYLSRSPPPPKKEEDSSGNTEELPSAVTPDLAARNSPTTEDIRHSDKTEELITGEVPAIFA